MYAHHGNSLHSDIFHTVHQLFSYFMLCGLMAECLHSTVLYNLDVEITPRCLIALVPCMFSSLSLPLPLLLYSSQ